MKVKERRLEKCLLWGRYKAIKHKVLVINRDVKGGSETVTSQLFHKQGLDVEILEKFSDMFKINGHKLLGLFQLKVL